MLHVIGVLPVTFSPDEYVSFSVAFLRLPDNLGAIAFISSVKFFVTLPASFSALTFTLNIPYTVDLPEILPFSFMIRPFGRPSAVHVIGFVPFTLIVTL